MNHHSFSSFRCVAAIISVLAVLLILSSCGQRNRYVSIVGYAQGGTYSIKLNISGVSRTAEELKHGIDSTLARIDTSLSGYNQASILSRFNAGELVIPDEIFLDIYEKCQGYYSETGGCVDVSAGALFDMWGFGFTEDSMPSQGQINSVLKSIGMKRLQPSMRNLPTPLSAADLLLEGEKGGAPQLNYNAVAQGYSCDLVAEYLKGCGVKDMLIDIGGEIFCSGYNPAGRKWLIGIDKPIDGNDVAGESLQGGFFAGPEPIGIVTSGNYRKFYVKDGKKYAHTIDPRTGYPVSHSLLSATVIAPTAAEADALATYCMVVGLDVAEAFISSRSDLEACLIYDVNGEFRTWTSDGFTLENL